MSESLTNKIMISGSTGLIGGHLSAHLSRQGFQIIRLVRSKEQCAPDTVLIDPNHGPASLESLEGLHGIVHLAGRNVASGRWSKRIKQEIWNSRVNGTRQLVDAVLKLKAPPAFFFCASGTGIYGSRGDQELDEDSPPGTGYLAELAQAWEREALRASSAATRVVLLRIGMVLSSKGGALAKMMLPFKLGLGGILGNGKQFMPWIEIDDLARAVSFLIANNALSGPINIISPNPVTNYEFTKRFGAILHRPTVLPVPAFVLRAILGDMADEMLLASARAKPKRLNQFGFKFEFADLVSALHHSLNLERVNSLPRQP